MEMNRINQIGEEDDEDESLDAPMIDASYMKASSKLPGSDASHNGQHTAAGNRGSYGTDPSSVTQQDKQMSHNINSFGSGSAAK